MITNPFLVQCPHCEDGICYISRYGGNDPDVWRVGLCETCEGSGGVPLRCEDCGEDATSLFLGRPFCEPCVAVQKADALVVGEDG